MVKNKLVPLASWPRTTPWRRTGWMDVQHHAFFYLGTRRSWEV